MFSGDVGVGAVAVLGADAGDAGEQGDVVLAVVVHGEEDHAGDADPVAGHVAADGDVERRGDGAGFGNEGASVGRRPEDRVVA